MLPTFYYNLFKLCQLKETKGWIKLRGVGPITALAEAEKID